MAVEILLRVDGVKGGSLNSNHRGWSDALSYRWLLNHDAGSSGRIQMNEIVIVKPVGVESTVLMTLFAAQTVIESVELNIIPVLGKREAPMKYLSMILKNVQIASISTGGAIEENVFKETVTLRFGSVKYESHHYAEASPNSTVRAAVSHAFEWDHAAA